MVTTPLWSKKLMRPNRYAIQKECDPTESGAVCITVCIAEGALGITTAMALFQVQEELQAGESRGQFSNEIALAATVVHFCHLTACAY